MNDLKQQYSNYQKLINEELEKVFCGYEDSGIRGLLDSMLYSLTAGGKRSVRFGLEFCRLAGGDHIRNTYSSP